mmetsp:Transcript_130344/g.239702  ORF Transcript_130344/g.239702 Transcript_130344/m.239702 type:complete len:351 (-) Transcript_130344:112-1164(-)
MRDSYFMICAILVGAYCVPTGLAAEEYHGADGISDETILLQIRQEEKVVGGQAQASKKKEGENCGYLLNEEGDPDTFQNNNRKYHSRGPEFYRSIVDVMAEHPGEDGFCYFNASAMYIGYNPEPPDFVNHSALSILFLRSLDWEYAGLNTGPRVTFHIEGETPTSHIDSPDYAYDDLYGYSLGYLQGQGLDTSKITNAAEWEALSAEQCDKFQQEYNFTKDELILNDLLDSNLPILAMSYCSTGIPLPKYMMVPYVTEKAEYHSAQDCKVITRREFARHHYMKCVLGHKNAGAEMSYSHARACLLDGNRIGHFEECPLSPMGMTGGQTDLLLQPALDLMWNMTLQAKGLM